MAMSNHERVGKGLDAVRSGLAPYVARELKAHYGESWWEQGVEASLQPAREGERRRGAKRPEEQLAALDAHALLGVLWTQWNAVFQAKLGHAGRTYVSELRDVRNKWAHQEAFTVENAHRALDTITRLLQMISSPEAEQTARLARDLLRLRFEEETRRELKRGAEVVTETGTSAGLKPWREVATPHPDVASGRYQQAEFAADLAQVLSGEAEDEYQNPLEFFRRTYLTEGLAHLLRLALKRLTGSGGDPVVELQTNFGGGKTHSLLALYHLVGGQIAAGEVPGLEPLLTDAGITALPHAKRAVLVGTKLNPATPQQKPDGTRIHTLWGELAHQLGAKKGYALVADADRKGVAPGSDTLKRLFDEYGPALVLIDEWVAFARQLYRVDGLPAGSFDANMTFAQALTEAARRSRNALAVLSIPSSDIEIGGEGGQAALERLRNTVGRMEAVWKPASAEETFEIVRRRLFEPIRDFAARDAVCRAFAEIYRDNRGEFPRECGEGDYERRLKGAYPIHPELFDRLYQDWSTLERFQRTRGVLRLMAAVIHNLWERQDKSLFIMPSTVPLDSPPVRYELTRYLPEGWGAIIDTDIDGPTSRPLAMDRDNPNLGRYSACRRVTRTVFVGSAPSVAAQRVRGLEEVRIKLGCVQPGEVPATFGDALRRLGEQLTYLYADGTRYWFDNHPSVIRLAADRADQQREDQVEAEIVRRLRERRDRGDFAGVHVAPEGSGDVPDEDAVRLVVLGPRHVHGARLDPSPARGEAQAILDHRGASPRRYKNMLVFLAPDKDRLAELNRAMRQWLAWKSIEAEKDQLNLDAYQRSQVAAGIKRGEETVVARLQETYTWLLVPGQEQDGPGPVNWETSRLAGGDESFVLKASKKLRSAEQLITQWSPALLKIHLDRLLWKDSVHIDLKKLWEYFATYVYLPRLKNVAVLIGAVREGLESRDYFGYAASVSADGRYQGLRLGPPGGTIHLDGLSVLVRPDAAARQLAEEQRKAEELPREPQEVGEKPGEPPLVTPSPPSEPGRPRRFHGSVTVDPTRLARDAGLIAQEVVQHLAGLVGAEVEISLEIHARIPDGAPEHVVRTVTENCRTLRFTSYGFEQK